jgi:hypothetical protein
MVKYKPQPVKLIGKPPAKCQGCETRIVDVFNDIKTWSGWRFTCDDCVPKYSIAKTGHYGTGLGQRWVKQGKDWIKQQG